MQNQQHRHLKPSFLFHERKSHKRIKKSYRVLALVCAVSLMAFLSATIATIKSASAFTPAIQNLLYM